jgi:hypothetical protein
LLERKTAGKRLHDERGARVARGGAQRCGLTERNYSLNNTQL